MKNRFLLCILALVLAASFTLGVTGTVTFAKEQTQENAGKDRLIGVFITKEHLDLFDFESYFNEHVDSLLSGKEISPSESTPYQGRLYATLVDDPYTNPNTGESTTAKRYVFEEVEGICYFVARFTDEHGTYWGTNAEEAISDGQTAFHSTDAGDNIDLKGTIFASTTKGEDGFYYNPVYQTPGGEVYAVTGTGNFYTGSMVAGMAGSQTQKDEQTVTVNGKSETIYTNVEVSVCYMDTPIETQLLQFDQNGNMVSEQKYTSGHLPERITVQTSTDYIIVQTLMKAADGTKTTTRELFQREDQNLFAFFCREDGICVKQYCEIVW